MNNKDIIAIVIVYVALMGLIFVVLGSGIANADTVYWYYEDCDGVATFTDRDQVPLQNRDDAKIYVTGPIEDYERYTSDKSPFVPAAQTPTPPTSTAVAPVASPSRVIVDINRYHPEPLYRP